LQKETVVDKERAELLLRAAYDILRQCHESIYVQNVMAVETAYDGVDCDGYCLMNDIADLLDLEQL
jgi:hypothetical protein